jgi:hypothetical protein
MLNIFVRKTGEVDGTLSKNNLDKSSSFCYNLSCNDTCGTRTSYLLVRRNKMHGEWDGF